MTNREKVIKGLECLAQKQAPTANPCKDCGYINRPSFAICVKDIASDALELLKEQNWVKCSDGMPEEHDSIFAKLKGTDKWRSAMFEKSSDDVRIVEVFEDRTHRVSHSHTIDGKWECEKHPLKRTITHWMPNPGLPEEGR